MHRPMDGSINHFTLCKNKRCIACEVHTYDCDSFTSSTYHAYFQFNDTLNCRTKNVIYLITCIKCRKQYIGETGRCLAERLTDHRSCIKNKKLTPVAVHFSKPDHIIERDLKAISIEKIEDGAESTYVRKERELSWWTRMGTRFPYGLNGTPIIKAKL